jgi:predicted membrane protein
MGSMFEHRDEASRATGDHPPEASSDESEAVELRKEAWVMALYVAVCLLAALSAVAEKASDGHVRAIGIVWGTTVGLTLAHVFAFGCRHESWRRAESGAATAARSSRS